MKRRPPLIAAACLAVLLAPAVQVASAKEAYWEEYQVELSELTAEQSTILESTLNHLMALEPGELKISKKMYRRLSRFEKLFGMPFKGRDLAHWLLSRIRKLSYRNTWTTALNQNQGTFFLGDAFFEEISVLERLYLLIHEARHSDNDGYKHIKCPKGFPYISARQPDIDLENEPTCDDNDHGAYAFQAAFLFELFSYGIFDQNEVGLLYNSSISRVVPPK